MKHSKNLSLTEDARSQRLSDALSQMDQLVQQSCAEVSAIAQMALVWLETPQGHQRIEAVARALQVIHNNVELLGQCASYEADIEDCGFTDPAEIRRIEAARAAGGQSGS